jgi:hypothetical protein
MQPDQTRPGCQRVKREAKDTTTTNNNNNNNNNNNVGPKPLHALECLVRHLRVVRHVHGQLPYANHQVAVIKPCELEQQGPPGVNWLVLSPESGSHGVPWCTECTNERINDWNVMVQKRALTVRDVPADGPKLASLLHEGMQEGQPKQQRLERLWLGMRLKEFGLQSRWGKRVCGCIDQVFDT